MIGAKTYEIWSNAASNIDAFLDEYQTQLVGLAQKVFGFASGAVIGVLQFVFSTIIAGALLLQSKGGYKASREWVPSAAPNSRTRRS